MRSLPCREAHQGWGWSRWGGGGRDYGPAACETQSPGGPPEQERAWQELPLGMWPATASRGRVAASGALSPTGFLIGSEACLVWVRKEGRSLRVGHLDTAGNTFNIFS